MPPVVIAAGISAIGGLAGAAIQSHQTSKAADTQTKAGEQAQANLKPFQDTGTQAFQTLGGLMGLGGGGGSVQTPSLSGTGPQGVLTRNSSANYPLPMGAISDPSKNGGYAGQVPGTATLGSSSSYQDNTSQYGPKSAPPGSTVKMQAPDGSVQDVPGAQVSHYQQLGAKVVG